MCPFESRRCEIPIAGNYSCRADNSAPVIIPILGISVADCNYRPGRIESRSVFPVVLSRILARKGADERNPGLNYVGQQMTDARDRLL